MARIIWKEKGAELRGTLCGIVYKVVNGKQRAYVLPQPEDPRGSTVYWCVRVIQRRALECTGGTVADRQRIADEYAAIKKAVERMFDDFLPVFRANRSMIGKAIAYWYEYKKLPPELDLFTDKLPTEYRDSPDNGSMLSDKNAALKAPRTGH